MTTRRRAFTLTEILMTLSLLVVVGLVLDQVFHATVTAWTDTDQTTRQYASVDSVISALRTDTWHASQITVSDSKHASLSLPDNSKITWIFSPDGDATRTDSSGHRTHWPSITSAWNFSADPATLTVTSNASSEKQQIRLISQVLLAARSRP